MSGLSCNEALMQSFAREDALSDAFDRLLLKVEQLEESNKELTLQLLAAHGQAADALDKLAKAVEALREIKSITVHSGGDLNRVKASAWRDAFEQAHCEACAVLAELEKQ